MEPDSHLSPMTPIDPPATYPSDLDREEVLADGTRMRIRPIVPADIERVRHAFAVGDPESIRRRFFTGSPPTGEAHLRYLVDIDYHRRLALVAMDLEGNSLGVARYEGIGEHPLAEIAIVVTPEWRNRGVALMLVEALELPAIDAGFEQFEAFYLPDNRTVADLLEGLGYGDLQLDDGLVRVTKLLL